MVPKTLPIPFGHKIMTGDIEQADVLESVSRISMAADIWVNCVKILKRNNWNSFVYLKRPNKNKKAAGCLLEDFQTNELFEATEVEAELLKAKVSMRIDRFKGNTYDISKMEAKLDQARSSAITVASKAMPNKFQMVLKSLGIKEKKPARSKNAREKK